MDAISVVKESEARASKSLRDAEVEARERYDQAVKDLKEKFSRKDSEFKEAGQALVETAKKDGEKEALPIKEEADQYLSKLNKIDKGKINDSIKFIVERIVNS